jgi:hypothetical protein
VPSEGVAKSRGPFRTAQTDSGDTVLVTWQSNGATYAVAFLDAGATVYAFTFG